MIKRYVNHNRKNQLKRKSKPKDNQVINECNQVEARIMDALISPNAPEAERQKYLEYVLLIHFYSFLFLFKCYLVC